MACMIYKYYAMLNCNACSLKSKKREIVRIDHGSNREKTLRKGYVII